jgi:hypothetical protein
VKPPLKLGLELLARYPAPLRIGTFFETWLATPAGTVRRSLGRDEYHLGLTIDAGRRLAATGRTFICQLDVEEAGLGINQARPALRVEAEWSPKMPLIWGIRTNRFLDWAALADGTTAQLIREGQEPLPFAMDHPSLNASEVAPGRFIIELSGLLSA